MATTETVIGQLPNGRLLIYFTQTGPASYTPPGISITINSLRKVEQVVELDNDGGYRTAAREATETLSGATFTLTVHYHTYACPGTSSGGTLAGTLCATGYTVPSGVSLAATTFSGLVTGF